MVPDEGFEPPTFGLQNRCTTTVLIRREMSGGAGSIRKHLRRNKGLTDGSSPS